MAEGNIKVENILEKKIKIEKNKYENFQRFI